MARVCTPTGAKLTGAAAAVIDSLAHDIRAQVYRLNRSHSRRYNPRDRNQKQDRTSVT
jgi:hypothetical protein